MIYICGPGHGGPGMVANAYLEGTYIDEIHAIQNEARSSGRIVDMEACQ